MSGMDLMPYRRKLADLLIQAARVLDPYRPMVDPGDSAGWQVMVGGMPLARIQPGAALINGKRVAVTNDDIQDLRPAANEVRDMLARSSPDHAGTVMARDQVVENWCAQHGKAKDSLSMDDILAIRSLPEWQNAG